MSLRAFGLKTGRAVRVPRPARNLIPKIRKPNDRIQLKRVPVRAIPQSRHGPPTNLAPLAVEGGKRELSTSGRHRSDSSGRQFSPEAKKIVIGVSILADAVGQSEPSDYSEGKYTTPQSYAAAVIS